MKIRTLLVEDHLATLHGIAAGLNVVPDIVVSAVATTSDDALAFARQTPIDIVVLDLHLPGSLKIRDLLSELSRCHSRSVIYTAENRMAYRRAAFECGANAYLLKSEPLPMLVDTIRKVSRGEMLRWCMDDSQLSSAEKSVLAMLACGKKYQQIADARQTAVSTVRGQCDKILIKLNLTCREELIYWAVTNGYADEV